MSYYLKKYMWVISLLAVVLTSFFLAKVATQWIALQLESLQQGFVSAVNSSSVVNDVAKEETPPSDYSAVIVRNIFDSKATGEVANQTSADTPVDNTMLETPTGEAVATTLPIKLYSTFSIGAGTDNRSSCVLSSQGSKEPDVYTVGEKKSFLPDTRLVKILPDRVEFINRNRLEYVKIEEYAKASPSGGLSARTTALPVPEDGGAKPDEVKIEKTGDGKFSIDRSEIDNAIANLDKLYTEVRAVPHFKDGNPDGLKLLSVKAGGLFSKLGLQRGDILRRINGNDLDIKKGLEIFNQLKNESNITLEVERKGSPQKMDYEIK